MLSCELYSVTAQEGKNRAVGLQSMTNCCTGRSHILHVKFDEVSLILSLLVLLNFYDH